MEDAPEKSKNQLKNEAKRSEKLAKFTAKQAKIEQERSTKKPAQPAAATKYHAQGEAAPSSVAVKEGEKKDLSQQMATSYSPKAVESSWYAWWEKSGFFTPEYKASGSESKERRQPFVITIPPPNITGALHLGHAMMIAIQDSIVRFKRMQGFETLYVPGCDHAALATQVVVEKKLKKEKGLTRHDLGREAFLQEVWKWKNQSGDRIYAQFKRMGVSTDWSRACFTMDEKFVDAVEEAFVQMHRSGLIFRDNRLVNWSARIQTTLSDLEVDSKELSGRTPLVITDHHPTRTYDFGVLTMFAYRVEGSNDEIVVATTRPETMLGDVAVAVHPTDDRYRSFVGKRLVHPFITELHPIVIADDSVDKEFGTGAVKVTPAHDPSDFKLARRHNLPMIAIFDERNVLNDRAGEFCGMKRFDARIAVVEKLKEVGLYRGEQDHAMVLPVCSRSGDIVEPRLMPQWWVNCRGMAKMSMEAVAAGHLRILPKEGEREWFRWLENIQDWCISRQLWWGHRIPVYHVDFEGKSPNPDSPEFWICGRKESEARQEAERRFPGEKITLKQDEDVLDTWFSAGLWPFGVLGWPNCSAEDMKRFYPTQFLETGRDILFFWVARMVMMGLQLTGQVPFSTVLLHSIVRDAHGRKLSKSLGNAVDPIDVVEGISLEALHAQLELSNLDAREIKQAKESQKMDYPNGISECGTDALRFALCASTNLSRDVNLNILRVEGYRRFCNKLWNATRFALLKLQFVQEKDGWCPSAASFAPSGNESRLDAWILHRLNTAIETTTDSLEQYNFMAATTAVYSFCLYDLCDVYIEGVKPLFENGDLKQRKSVCDILYECLESTLKLLHPFMPYVTEELYQRLPRRPNDRCPAIIVSSFPTTHPGWVFPKEYTEFDSVLEVVSGIRSAVCAKTRQQRNLAATLSVADPSKLLLLEQERGVMHGLLRNFSELSLDASASGDPVAPGVSITFTSE